MTNREWLNSIDDTAMAAKVVPPHCECEYCIINAVCNHAAGNCINKLVEWLKQKHIESMPRIKIGDVIYCNICNSKAMFVVMSDIYASNLGGIIVRWRELKDIWKIKRMNDEKEMLEVIWRADNDT